MSNREQIINLTNSIPESELLPIVELLKSLYRLTVTSKYEEVEPDELDLEMIAEAEKDDDNTTYTLDEVLKECGLTYDDLQD